MNKTGKKIGFIRGRLETLDMSDTHVVRMFISAILDTVDELSDRLDENEQRVAELNDFTQELDDAIYDLEGNMPAGVTLGELLFGEGVEAQAQPQLSVIKGNPESDRERFLKPALCANCGKTFMCEPSMIGSTEKTVVCPHCTASVNAVVLSVDNTPIAKPINEQGLN